MYKPKHRASLVDSHPNLFLDDYGPISEARSVVSDKLLEELSWTEIGKRGLAVAAFVAVSIATFDYIGDVAASTKEQDPVPAQISVANH